MTTWSLDTLPDLSTTGLPSAISNNVPSPNLKEELLPLSSIIVVCSCIDLHIDHEMMRLASRQYRVSFCRIPHLTLGRQAEICAIGVAWRP